jgi:hypothetical protein
MQIARGVAFLAAVLASSVRALAQAPPLESLPTPAPIADSAPLSPVEAPLAGAGATLGPDEYWIDSAPAIPSANASAAALPPCDLPSIVAATETLPGPPASPSTPAGELFGYDTLRGQTTWLIGKNDRFGFVSLESIATLRPGENRGVVAGFSVHFLDGPIVTDMPARLFDFTIGYQTRRWITPNFGVDFVGRVGAFSDFEGSARDGVRFPSHAVSFTRINPELELLLGIDYLDRDDISLLPVFGAVWAPSEHVRIDAVFPRPCAAVQIGESKEWLYLRGQLGGGTWAIERVPPVNGSSNDNATYRDVRLALGFENRDTNVMWSSIELGYVFARQLSYRSSPTDFDFGDAMMLNFTNTY